MQMSNQHERLTTSDEVPELLVDRRRSTQESPSAPSVLRIAVATFATCCLATGVYSAASSVGGGVRAKVGAAVGLEEAPAEKVIDYHGISPSDAKIIGDTVIDVIGIPMDADKDIAHSCASDQMHPAWPCCNGEEIFFNDCFRSCDNITNGQFPYRTDECTCCKSLPCMEEESVKDCEVMNKDICGGSPHKPILTSCPYDNEELWLGLCYTKCSLLTRGQYPERTGINTCSNGKKGGNWTMGVGLCSGFGTGGTKCLPHIPEANGMGFEQPDKQPGVAPMGFQASFPAIVGKVYSGSR